MLEEKIDQLTSAIERLTVLMSTSAPAPATQPAKVEQKDVEVDAEPKKKRGRPAKVESVESQPKVEEVKAVVEDTPGDVAQEEDEDDFALDDDVKPSAVTADMLRNVLKELRDVDKKQIGILMTKYKAKAFSDLDEADYSVIYAEAKGLING